MQSLGTQDQLNSVCFDVTNTFDTVTHSRLLDKVSTFGLSPNYANWLRRNLIYTLASFRVSGLFPAIPTHVCGPSGLLSEPLLFDAFINDGCNPIFYGSCPLSAKDLKLSATSEMLGTLKRCIPTFFVQKWPLDNGTKLNVGKTTFVSFTGKINPIAFVYKLVFTHIKKKVQARLAQ